MIQAGPGYINENCLPYASDIFYHEHIAYYLPTGFHPIEFQSVIEFPGYCNRKSIAFPTVFWVMFSKYFENSKASYDAIKILEPLRDKHITIITLIYPRGRTAINNTKDLLTSNQNVYNTFTETYFDVRFIARELLSHLLFEIFLQDGLNGVVGYLRENSEKPEDFLKLVAAVMINRLLQLPVDTMLLYEHNYINILKVVSEMKEKGKDNTSINATNFGIEHFRYKLFESLLIPIYGKCDTEKKSLYIANVASKKAKEIENLKSICYTISREVFLLPTDDDAIRQTKLTEMIKQYIEEPLGALIQKKSTDVKNILTNFTLDSTLISALLSLLQKQVNIENVVIGVTAAALSTGIKSLLYLNENSQKSQPNNLLVEGMQKFRIEYEQYEKYLSSISMNQLKYPSS